MVEKDEVSKGFQEAGLRLRTDNSGKLYDDYAILP